MSRTFRRKRERHEYYWVLLDWDLDLSFGRRVLLDLRSKAGRKAIARFHSDKATIVGKSVEFRPKLTQVFRLNLTRLIVA